MVLNAGSTTSFTIHNPNEVKTIQVDVNVYSPAGEPLADRHVELLPGETVTVLFGQAQAALTRGWAELKSEDEFIATEFFQLFVGELKPRVGVVPSLPAEEVRFLGFVNDQLKSGMAVHNPSPTQETRFTIRARDHTGREPVEEKTIRLGPRQSKAAFLNDPLLFGPALGRFEGVVEIEDAEPPLAVLSLIQEQSGDVATVAVETRSYDDDFGEAVEELLVRRSSGLFGIPVPLADQGGAEDYVPRERASAQQRQLLAEGLQAQYVTRNIGQHSQEATLYPNDVEPTHVIVCLATGRSGSTPGGSMGLNPSIQRVDLATGEVTNVLFGMEPCDGLRQTPWGTLLATENAPDGRVYELLDPLQITGHWLANRASGQIREAIDSPVASTQIVQRVSLPTMSWESLIALPSGVVIGSEELAPGGLGPGSNGGSIFKFAPDQPRTIQEPIVDLSESPLTSGRAFALQISCRSAGSEQFPEFGQGCGIGNATWVEIDPLRARSDADSKGATGYNLSEDLELDFLYQGPGVRFYWANSGRVAAGDRGEVLYAIDPNPLGGGLRNDPRTGFTYLADPSQESGYAVAIVQRFFLGRKRFHSLDSLALQPSSGNLFIVEDAQFGEIFVCLTDGEDRDLQTDGCVRVLSIVDPEAEPTGIVFESSGEAFYYIVATGEQPDSLLDFETNPLDGFTADLIRINGFRVPTEK